MASRNAKTLRVGALPTSEVDVDRATRAFDPLRVRDILDRHIGDQQSHLSHSSFHSALFGCKSDVSPDQRNSKGRGNISHLMDIILLQNEFFFGLMKASRHLTWTGDEAGSGRKSRRDSRSDHPRLPQARP
jgi:hypothetical protein